MITITITNKQLTEKELSQIFNLLKHPLRRGILKQLSKSPQAYSQILKNLKIPESSILNYHLREMVDLMIIKDVNGKYELNEVGQICLQLLLKSRKRRIFIDSINFN
ncbi:MAG: winged helix-turn-helix domain-containing protein [Promethearchaeota archaeon]